MKSPRITRMSANKNARGCAGFGELGSEPRYGRQNRKRRFFAGFGRNRDMGVKKRGMTLIEILVGIAISTILAGAGYAVYAAATSGWEKSRRRIDMRQRGQSALELMARCLRAAQIPDSADDLVFEGDNVEIEAESTAPFYSSVFGDEEDGAVLNLDSLGFRTNAPIHLFGDEETPDQVEVEFYLEGGPEEEIETETGIEEFEEEDLEGPPSGATLLMRVDPTYDADMTGGGWIVEVVDGIEQLNFSFYNGSDWKESWTSSDGPPTAVEVGLSVLDPLGKERPMVFTRICPIQSRRDLEQRLPVASDGDASFSAARSRSAAGEEEQ
jgi:prepilin-type N-terminal cleavage/methylation domain-containing protein